MTLEDKVIIITGGTSGIGYHLVKQLHRKNRVVVIGRDKNKLDFLGAKFDGVQTFQADLSILSEVSRVGRLICEKFIHIDVLINNAAVQYTPYFNDKAFQFNSIAKEVNTNFTSVCCLTHLLLPNLTHEQHAVILNVNSGLALAPKTSSAVYCATKSALKSFSTSLAYQLKNTNVAIHQAFLPLVATNMTAGRAGDKLAPDYVATRLIEGIKNNHRQQYIGKAKLLSFLMHITPVLAMQATKNA